ncbi:hypothetical protein AB9T88_01500 [Flavobacterium sp. LBUM151]
MKRIKVLTIVIAIIITVILYVVFIAVFWNSSKDKREDNQYVNEYQEQNFKSIFFNNKFNEKVYVIINFEYTKDEINQNNLKIIDYYNKKDSILLQPNEKYSVFLPIYNNAAVRFPIKFKVIVKDSIFNVIKNYDEELFFKESKTKPKIEKVQEKYKAAKWELDLKK